MLCHWLLTIVLYTCCEHFSSLVSKNCAVYYLSISVPLVSMRVINKEWDFFYGAVNLHARLTQSHAYLVLPFGSSRAPFSR